MKDDDRFPLYLKVLWGAVLMLSSVLAYLLLIPAADWHEGYGRIALFILLLVVWIPLIAFALLGTMLWFEVVRKK